MVRSTTIILGSGRLRSTITTLILLIFFVVAWFVSAIAFFSFYSIAVPVIVVVVHTGIIEVSFREIPEWNILLIPRCKGVETRRTRVTGITSFGLGGITVNDLVVARQERSSGVAESSLLLLTTRLIGCLEAIRVGVIEVASGLGVSPVLGRVVYGTAVTIVSAVGIIVVV